MIIKIEDYNPQWREEFHRLKAVYLSHMSHLDVDIQHVGSTSVVGLAAKPILDIDIIVNSEQELAEVIEILGDLGYKHVGDLGINGREAFKRISKEVPYHHDDNSWLSHHLYAGIRGSLSLENHLRFRDYLRNNPNAVSEYAHLKKKLAEKYADDIDAYIENKTAFITKILAITGISEADIEDISEQNKK